MTGLISAELLKLRTIRTPVGFVLALLVVAGLSVAATIGADSIGLFEPPADELARAAATALVFATLLAIVLVTNEFRHGTITQTFLGEPVRERVVAAKLAAGTAAGTVLGLLAAALLLAIALPWLESRGEPLALDGELAAALLRLVLAFALAGALGVAIGFVIRSQVGAIVATLAWFLVVESLVTLASRAIWRDFDAETPLERFLPGRGFNAFVAGGDERLSTWVALLVVCAWVAALLAAGVMLTRRRDAV